MDDLTEFEGSRPDKSAKQLSEEIGEDPNKKWWDELSQDGRQELLKAAVAEKIATDTVGSGDRISYKQDRSMLFAAAKAESADFDNSIVYRRVYRVHLVPNAEEAKLTEGASAEFIYNRIDQQRLGLPDPELPTVVNIIRRGEASIYSSLSSGKGQDGNTELGENEPVPGSEMIDYEEARLHPLYTAHKIGNFLSSSITVFSGGQHLNISFNPSDGEVYGIRIEDFLGRDKSGRGVVSPGMNLTSSPLGSSSLTEVLKGKPAGENGFTATSKPGNIISITRSINGEESSVLEIPQRLDVKKGLSNLFDMDSIERPFDAPMSDDLWLRTPITKAFGIAFTPHPPSPVGNLMPKQ